MDDDSPGRVNVGSQSQQSVRTFGGSFQEVAVLGVRVVIARNKLLQQAERGNGRLITEAIFNVNTFILHESRVLCEVLLIFRL